jgi:hypothetical protein
MQLSMDFIALFALLAARTSSFEVLSGRVVIPPAHGKILVLIARIHFHPSRVLRAI